MQDIEHSLSKFLVKNGFIFGELMNRIGDPFQWVDGNKISHLKTVSGVLAVLQYLAMSGEIYKTPFSIKTENHDHLLTLIEKQLTRIYDSLVPFTSSKDYQFNQYIQSTASVKVQDYCSIRHFCNDLPSNPKQLDIGPGLGANAIYSLFGLNAVYYSLEAFPHSYEVQRMFFRSLLGENGSYLDLIECENFNLEECEIRKQLNDTEKYRIKHVPSWHFGLVGNESIDLVTATWVLNEVTPAGIAWLLSHVNRVLCKGGYVYIRDSGKRKPLRHDLNYDHVLLDLGFTHVGTLDVQNRIDMHGIPRVYRKVKNINMEYKEFFDWAFGRFVVTAHGGNYMQTGEPIKMNTL